MPEQRRRPTAAELEAARDKTVPDVIAPGLRALFVGINPGLYTAAIGHHFGRPGNRFWPTLHAAGFTPRLFSPYEERQLLDLGYGISNMAPRATATADELDPAELVAGRALLEEKIHRYRPRWVAFLGIGAYRQAFGRPKARLGEQVDRIGAARVWVLPNPSGLNAHYRGDQLAALFSEFRAALDNESASPSAQPPLGLNGQV